MEGQEHKTAIIVGGGIFGLCRTYALRKMGYEVTLLEKEQRVGGVIQTVCEEGFIAERGPNTLRTGDAAVLNLFNEIGVGVVESTAASNDRYIVYKGKLVKASRSVKEFLKTPVFSVKGKLRILMELFQGRKKEKKEESVAEFFRRRFGKEVVDYGVDPLVSGVYAGDCEKLSMRHVFPKIHKMEETYGSLLKGFLNSKKRSGSPVAPKVLSFEGGMEGLIDQLAKVLGKVIIVGIQLQKITQVNGKWEVVWQQGSEVFKKQVDELIITVPAYALRDLPFEEEIQKCIKNINTITYAPIATVNYGFKAEAIEDLRSGFGFLVPSKEPFEILGTLFTSSFFLKRAPEGHVLLTTFLGGTRRSELVGLDDAAQDALIMEDLRKLLKIESEPVWKNRTRWEKGIPQFEIGYERTLEQFDNIEKRYRGLQFLGNYRNGVSLEDAIKVGLVF